jgi:ribosomal protein S18 acetylase RimI-like enzyme
MTIRDLNLPKDLAELGSMLAESFQYPENPDWGVQDDERESLVEDIAALRRSWWMIQIGQVFIPAMRNLLPGKVWEEDGKIAGVVLLQQRGSSNHWVVGTVATRPEYRRRGIARKLVEAGLDFLREKGAENAILDVIDANHPAYQLYLSLGFEHYSGNLDLDLSPDVISAEPEPLEGYQFEPVSLYDWQTRFEIMKQISPEGIQKYEPVDESLFRQPGYMRVIMPLFARAQKVEQQVITIRHMDSDQLVGYLRWDARKGGKGRHGLGIRLAPEHAHIARQMLEYGLNHLRSIDSSLIVEMGMPSWQTYAAEAAYEIGFQKRLLYHRLGLVL